MPKDVVYKPIEKPKTIYSGGTLTPPKFMPSYYEWLSMRGTQVIQGGSATIAGDYSAYTVPEGFVFFLTSAYVGICDPANPRTQVVMFVGSSGVKKILSVACNVEESMYGSFNPPIRLLSGETIVLSFLGNALVNYGIYGFLIKDNEIPTL